MIKAHARDASPGRDFPKAAGLSSEASRFDFSSGSTDLGVRIHAASIGDKQSCIYYTLLSAIRQG